MKKQSKKLKLKKSVLFISFVLIALTGLILLQFTRMEAIEEESLNVEFNSELSYTLSVTYDGVDRNGDKSNALFNSDNKPKIVKVNSGYIYVEDVIPEGLEFVRFNIAEGNDNLVIGAVKQDENTSGTCSGYIENDSKGSTDPKSNHGLHYDETTGKVSFKIKNLTAGCKLNVTIITKTPKVIEGNRKDFYNTATAWEGSQLAYSNMVHAYMQKEENVEVNNVTYQFTGQVPVGIEPPREQQYATGAIVGIANNINIEGYTFSNWIVISPLGLNTTGNKFTMPSEPVILQGYFTEKEKYNVSYKIDGEGPKDYVLPISKDYYENVTVKLDSMNVGDEFKGYRFLGWNIDGVEISEDKDFQMPAKNIEVVGKWEKMKYKVTYDFYEGVRPSNYQEILDNINNQENSYYPGDNVFLPNVSDIAPSGTNLGYHFLGWYENDGFTMPNENITIYGEWMTIRGTFVPTITKEIVNKKDYYHKGETVVYNITVTNHEDYEIRNVQIKEDNENSQFLENSSNSYNIRSTHIVEIPSIPPKGSIMVAAKYEVTEKDKGTINNKVQIVSGSADNNDLDISKEYIAESSFDVYSEIKIRNNVIGDKNNNSIVFQYHITSENGYDTWINLSNSEEEIVYVEPNDIYTIKELVPQEYSLESVSGDITSNNESINIRLGEDVIANFTNQYQRKNYYHSSGRVVNIVESKEVGYVVNYYYSGVLVDTINGIGNVRSKIPYDKTSPKEYNGHNYVIDKIENENGVVTENAADNVINVYYELDELKDPIVPDQGDGDGIPDKYQVTILYEGLNGTLTGDTKRIMTLRDEDGNPTSRATITPSVGTLIGYPKNSSFQIYSWGYGLIPDNPITVSGGETITYTLIWNGPLSSDITAHAYNPETGLYDRDYYQEGGDKAKYDGVITNTIDLDCVDLFVEVLLDADEKYEEGSVEVEGSDYEITLSYKDGRQLVHIDFLDEFIIGKKVSFSFKTSMSKIKSTEIPYLAYCWVNIKYTTPRSTSYSLRAPSFSKNDENRKAITNESTIKIGEE